MSMTTGSNKETNIEKMTKQDGYTWKCEFTDLSGQQQTLYIVSKEPTITSGTPLSITDTFSSATEDCPVIGSRHLGNGSLCGITITAAEAMDFVNYNKKNKVVIDFTRPSGDEIVRWTDDFVPNSEGAVYEMYGTDGRMYTFVVGETPEGWTSPFRGSWLYNIEGEIVQPSGAGDCEIASSNGTYYIECHEK